MSNYKTCKFLVLIFLFFCSTTTVASSLSDKFYQLDSVDIQKGEKLADVLLCTGCHAPLSLKYGMQMYDPAVRLTGGIKIISPPDGIFYSRNLTPDPETGLGNWSWEEIATAITAGSDKHGNGLRIIPWTYYEQLSNQDLNDLIAYLQNIKPVYHRIPENEDMPAMDKIKAGLGILLPFVANPSQDWLYGDFGSFDKQQNFPEPESPLILEPVRGTPMAPEPLESNSQIEHGKYLVTTAACGFCHTAVSGLDGQLLEDGLGGGFKVVDPVCGTIVSSNITSDVATGIGSYTDQELIAAIRQGRGRDGRTLCPSVMPWQAYIKFSDEEVAAIIAYLRATPPVSNRVPGPEPVTGEEREAQQFVVGNAGEQGLFE